MRKKQMRSSTVASNLEEGGSSSIKRNRKTLPRLKKLSNTHASLNTQGGTGSSFGDCTPQTPIVGKMSQMMCPVVTPVVTLVTMTV